MQLNLVEIARKVEPALSQSGDVVAAYLFGSAAKNRLRPGSDIDIAVLLDEEGVRVDRKAMLDQLLPLLCRALRMDVHLVFLNDASYLMRWQVFRDGKLLYEKDRRKLARFRMISVALFADFAPYLRMTQRGMENRLRKRHGG